MALTGTNRGSGSNAVAATSYSMTTASNAASGSLLVFCVAYDNAGGGGADPFNSISDGTSNVWTSRIAVLNDPGAASAGSVLRIFTCTLTATFVAATDFVVVSFGNTSVPVKAWTFTEVSGDSGTATYVTGNSATGNATTQTITSGSITSGNLILGALGQEGNGTRTGDSDTTNGSWSTAQSNGAGTTTSGMEIITQYKVVNATGTQTFNPTATPLGDWCIGWIEVNEVISTSFDPFGMMGFYGI